MNSRSLTDNRQISRNRDLAALAFEQHAERRSSSAQNTASISGARGEIGKRRAAERNRVGTVVVTMRLGSKGGCLHGVAVTFEAPLYPWIHACAEKSDAPCSRMCEIAAE